MRILRDVEQELSIDRQGRSFAQTFSGLVVDLIGDGIELLRALVVRHGLAPSTKHQECARSRRTARIAALQPLTRVTNRQERVERQHPPPTDTVWPTLEQPPSDTEAALPMVNGRRATPCVRLPRARYNPSALSLR